VTVAHQPTAAVIGLGLVGGSLARDLAERGWRVVAADRDRTAVEAAIASGVVDLAFDADGSSAAMPATVQIIVVAAPVGAVPRLLRWLGDAAPPGAVITDVASTKRTVMAVARAAGIADRFVGSHPMTGDHRSGWTASRRGLFAGVPVWLCPDGADTAALNRVAALWTAVGARPAVTDAGAHDRLVAWSSHLPQVAASALGAALARGGVGLSDLGPGGRDATRLAGSDPALWCDIIGDNADLLAPALDVLIEELERLRAHVHTRDQAAMRAALAAARSWADAP
jgi:prephenate dehydrogenase